MSDPTESFVPTDYLHDDVQAVAEYRSVSHLAVLAAVLGACSLVAMVNSTLLVVPLLGVICAVLALRRIAASEGQLVGRTAALVGLALSLAIGTGVYVRDATLKRLVATEAQQWALEWCDLLRDGKVLIALELKNLPEARRPLDESLADYYETNDTASEALEKFQNEAVVQLLTSAPEGARVVAGNLLGLEPDGRGGFLAGQEFRLVSPENADASSATKFRLYLARSRVSGTGGGAWYLTDHKLSE